MELADVLDSKSSGSDTVSVRPRSPAPTTNGMGFSPCHLLFARTSQVGTDYFAKQSIVLRLITSPQITPQRKTWFRPRSPAPTTNGMGFSPCHLLFARTSQVGTDYFAKQSIVLRLITSPQITKPSNSHPDKLIACQSAFFILKYQNGNSNPPENTAPAAAEQSAATR